MYQEVRTKSAMRYTKQIDQQFKSLMESQFGEYLVVGFIDGRGAFRMADPTMDIDTFVILDDKILKDKKMFQQKWNTYVTGYRDIHVAYGFKPDNAFPGDFATVSQISDVVNGRGFVEKNGQIFQQPMGSISDESNENDYRIFRSMLIIGRYICGNEAFFNEMKLLSLTCLIKYLFIKKRVLTEDSIITELLSGKEKELYGFDKRYEPYFSQYMKPKIQNVLLQLSQYGYITAVSENKYKAQQALFSWGKTVVRRKWTADHLLEFGDPYYGKQTKKIFKGYNAGSHWDKLK